MTEYDATEIAFNNGYEKGRAEAEEEINRKNAKIEKLNFENLQMLASIKGLKETARAEAIKEFAESVKCKMFCEDYLLCEPCDMADIIDQIAKEMGVE